ncbi:MAG: hydrogenase maturation protease [Alphaproteobacteria bacterium]
MNGAEAAPARPDLVIGVGHSFRCDDGAGPVVARALAARGVPAVVHEGEGSALLELWEHRHRVIVVDAVAGGEPGAIIRLDAQAHDLQTLAFVRSTHDLGLPEAIALGREFGRLPRHLSIIGIGGDNFTMGEQLSAPVRVAVDHVIAELTDLHAMG